MVADDYPGSSLNRRRQAFVLVPASSLSIASRALTMAMPSKLPIEVEFSYSGKPYQGAVLDAWVLKDGKYFPGVWGSGPAIEAGRHKDTVFLFFDPKATPGRHETQELAFGFSEARDGAERNTTRPFKVLKFQRVSGTDTPVPVPSATQAPTSNPWRLGKVVATE